MQYKTVLGWWCPCVGPGAGVGHHAGECARRLRVAVQVPTDPAWRPPRAKWLDGEPDAPDLSPIVMCREVAQGDDVPPTAQRMLRKALALRGVVAYLTYAKGWGRRKGEAGQDGVRHFEAWPLESVALRVPTVCNLAWSRLQGAGSWTAGGGYARWGDRIHPVNATQAGRLLDALRDTLQDKGSRS